MWMVVYPPLWINGYAVEEDSRITDGKYHVLQFGGPILPRQKEELKKLGLRFYGYYPKFAFVVSGDGGALKEALSKPYVVRIVPIDAKYKLPKFLNEKLNSGCLQREGDLYRARVVLFSDEDLARVENLLRKRFKVVHSNVAPPYVEVLATAEELVGLTRLDEVQFVEFMHHRKLWNDRKAVNHQSGLWADLAEITDPTDTIVWAKGIHGEGQILGHNDDGLNADHCFFSGNVGTQSKIVDLCDYEASGCGASSLPPGTNCDGSPGTGCHGSHTAGTAVGWSDAAGTSNVEYRGMAYMARIVSQSPLGGGSSGFGTVLSDAYERGARVHTNSWGYTCFAGCAPTDYNTDAQTIDNFMWNNRDMLVVFAAGNHGDDRCQRGCYSSASDPGTAKNDLTVGAMGRDVDAKMGWSAYGIYASGRFSVDVLAIGDTTYSVDGSTTCGITTSSRWMGTSMATPSAAGSALLIRQYYREGWYGDGTEGSGASITPSGALLKASILASAVPVAHDNDVEFGSEFSAGDSPVPNGNEGVGRIVLDNFMYFCPEDAWETATDSADIRKSSLWFVDNTTGLNTGDSVVYSIDITNPHMITRFVLTWTDYPASLDCATSTGGCLVNDLDLVVRGPGGEVFVGNNTTTGTDNLTPDDATASPDRANTWEIVRVSGISGTFNVVVKGYNVPQGPQPFALVVSGGVEPTCRPLGQDDDLSVEEAPIRARYSLRLTSEGVEADVVSGGPITLTAYDVSGRVMARALISERGTMRIPRKGIYMVVVSQGDRILEMRRYVIR